MRFQSTPPHARGDLGVTPEYVSMVLFQSTPPMRGATGYGQRSFQHCRISIHAPHAGGDANLVDHDKRMPRFQSTPPMRGATPTRPMRIHPQQFQSTPPMRGATYVKWLKYIANFISIHAPHAGGDLHDITPNDQSKDFNPRPPCGGRPLAACFPAVDLIFQSTPPMRGATI